MPRNYRKRDLVSVVIKMGQTTINYGFNTGLIEGQRANFGQVAVANSLPTGFVFGANAPKPARASKRTTTGYNSSYAADDKIKTLREAGWRTTRKKTRGITSGGLSRTVYVTIGGINYAWNLPSSASEPTSLEQVGIKNAKVTDLDLIFGAEFPKPPRYAIAFGEGDAGGTYSTYIDPEKETEAVGAGWNKVKPARYYPL
ncbi:MAG: hypothetical protein IGS23_14055 [Rivularia sp. T60_A2020_040]|nr:hypothetical protein [Rivularia sp. T60_A2020_040]